MTRDRRQSANADIRRITWLAVWVNVGLSCVKIAVGLLTGSLALIADGVHSFSDFATDLALLLGLHYGSKGPDACHPYGHGRAETFVAALMAGGLLTVGAGMIWRAAAGVARMHATGDHHVTISVAVLWAAMLAVVTKEVMYHLTRRVAIRTHSAMVYANAWEQRSDALSSIAVIVGAVAVRYGNFPHGDQIAAIVVGLMVLAVAAKILRDCYLEISERAVDARTIEQINQVIAAEHRIRSWHKLRTRNVGREIFVDVHVLVDPAMNITDAHAVSESLESSLVEQMVRPVNVMVHVEPDVPEQRK